MDAELLFADRFGTFVELGVLRAFAASAAVGLLMGLERERHPAAAAGLRTFTLTALFGTASALLGELIDAAWPIAIGLLLVGAMAVAAQRRDAWRDGDPGTTTTISLLLCFTLGTMTWHGLATIAASLAVVITALLYFKPELKGLSERISRRDMLSILQFGALSLVVLPALPNRGFGPHGVLNPYQIWLMVVLISGVSLAGYVALRLAGPRRGLLLSGLLGGLVSSTATTVSYARRVRSDPSQARASALVILLAGAVLFARVALLAALLGPSVLPALASVLLAAGAPMLVAGLVQWRRLPVAADAEAASPQVGNPMELGTALGFAGFYALVLLLAAEFAQRAGAAGLYLVALFSGLSNLDALTLGSLRLLGVGGAAAHEVVVAIALAFVTNTAFRLALAAWIGGRGLVRASAAGFLGSMAALLAAIALLLAPLAGNAAVALRQ